MKNIILALTLLIATSAFAQSVPLQQKPDTQKDCEQILQAFSAVQISAGQAEMISQIQKAIGVICRRSIDAEKKAEAAATSVKNEEHIADAAKQ